MTLSINIIPNTYKGDPREALGYLWQDLTNRVPGHDVIVTTTDNGIDYIGAAKQAMISLGVSEANINCMWCGGWSGVISNTNLLGAEALASAGEVLEETASIVRANEKMLVDIQDDDNEHHPGYCTRCNSYCYGDCEA